MVDNTEINRTDKWYDSPGLVDALLFFLPPIGFYALLKSDKLISKPIKIIASVFLFAGMCTLLYLIIFKQILPFKHDTTTTTIFHWVLSPNSKFSLFSQSSQIFDLTLQYILICSKSNISLRELRRFRIFKIPTVVYSGPYSLINKLTFSLKSLSNSW